MAGFWEKSEPRRPKSEGNPKSDARKCPAANGLLVPVAFGFLDRASVGQPAVSLSGFGFRASFGFRPSDFGFRIWSRFPGIRPSVQCNRGPSGPPRWHGLRVLRFTLYVYFSIPAATLCSSAPSASCAVSARNVCSSAPAAPLCWRNSSRVPTAMSRPW